MSKSVEQLIMALNKEYDIYTDYIELANKKKQVIVQGNMKELDNITKLEQSMIHTIGKIDQVRGTVVGNILLEKNIAYVETITELAEYLEPREKTTVLQLRDKLQDLFKEIQRINEINSKLIEQSLEYIDFNLNLVTSSTAQKGNTYGNQANEKQTNVRPNLFDAKF